MYRVGATSYVIPADILPNVAHLGPAVDDVELVLFETDEHGSNLPDAASRARLARLAAEHSLSYTVHLPLDVLPGAGEGSDCLVKARRVIEATRDLRPLAYTLHLDGRPVLPPPGGPEPSRREIEGWRDGAARALETVASWAGDPALLAVENLEGWDPELFAPVLDRVPVSRTADVGHLWLTGANAVDRLEAWMGRTRVVHLHGIASRDHASLALVSPEMLDPVVELLERRFNGVVTLEVFSDPDLRSSLAALAASRARVQGGGRDGR